MARVKASQMPRTVLALALIVMWTYVFRASLVNFELVLSVPSLQTEKLLLIGVFSTAEDVERRNLLRSLYSSFQTTSKADIYFIIGESTEESQTKGLIKEQNEYNDLMILDIKENMNGGFL